MLQMTSNVRVQFVGSDKASRAVGVPHRQRNLKLLLTVVVCKLGDLCLLDEAV